MKDFFLNKYLKVIFVILLIVYSFSRCAFFYNLPEGNGDEIIFINDLKFLKNNGLLEAIEHKISIPHTVLVFPFTFFMKEFIALRFVNSILVIALLFYLYKAFKNKVLMTLFLYYCVTANNFFIGTNDGLFFFCLTIFFVEIYLIVIDRKKSVYIAYTALIIAIFTRQLIVMYIFSIIFSFYILYKRDLLLNLNSLSFLFIFFLFGIFVNIPSLLINKQLSYDNKIYNKDKTINWVERQYLSQLYVNSGKIPDNSHVSWEELKEYKRKYGENSLPKNYLQVITFNPKATAIESVKDFLKIISLSIRQVGLSLVFAIFIFFCQIKSIKNLKFSYIPIVLFLSLSTFCLIIFSYIELRWLFSIFIISTLMLYSEDVKHKISNILLFRNLNFMVITIMMFYGIYKLLFVECVF